MNQNQIILGIVVTLALAAAAYLFFTGSVMAPAPAPATAQVYTSEEQGISFLYPEGYYLMERSVGSDTRPQTALVLVEDTEENRAVLDGTATTPREGPTAITVDIYPNPEQLSSSAWIENDTNWTIRTSDMTPTTVGGKEAVSYTWSGLYEGRSTVVTEGDRAYVFSVTWMTPEDPLLTDYEELLQNVQLHD